MKILIADDHIILREGVKQVLSDIRDAVFGEAGNAQQTLDQLAANFRAMSGVLAPVAGPPA